VTIRNLYTYYDQVGRKGKDYEMKRMMMVVVMMMMMMMIIITLLRTEAL
jgi:hypothetical protein